MTPTLILAAGPGWAELAARLVADDAVVCIGDPADREQASVVHDHIVISGPLDDERWVSAAFEVAAHRLGSGRRVALIVADGDPDRIEEGAAAPSGVPLGTLPAAVAAAWRVVGVVVEHPVTAIAFQVAAETDGLAATDDWFRRAQAAARSYRHHDGTHAEQTAPTASDQSSDDHDAEVAGLRRELDAYRNSTLGRLTTRYWSARRRLGARLRRRR